MRSTLRIVTLAAMLGSACGGTQPEPGTTGGGNPVGPSTTTNQSSGSLAFSTTASRGWSSIDISVDGRYVGTLSRYFESQGQGASCAVVAEARIATSVSSGSHTYSARTNLGATWSGSSTVSSGGCHEVVLTCANGDCSR